MSATAVAPRARQWVSQSRRVPPAVRPLPGVQPPPADRARAAEVEALHAYGAAVTAALAQIARGEQLYAALVVGLAAHVKALAVLGVAVSLVGER